MNMSSTKLLPKIPESCMKSWKASVFRVEQFLLGLRPERFRARDGVAKIFSAQPWVAWFTCMFWLVKWDDSPLSASSLMES